MSQRTLKPCSSRSVRHASSRRAGSTTSVVSPSVSRVSTTPGTFARILLTRPRPRISYAGGDAGADLLVQTDDALEQRLRPRRAAGDVDVHRDDLVDALEDRVVVEHPAGARARAHGDDPLRLEHLVVDLADRRRHLVRHATRDDEQVRLARRRAEALHAEARDVVARRDDRDHLHRAAREPERVRPDGVRLRPRDRLLDRRQDERVLDLRDFLLEDARPSVRPEDALGLEARLRERPVADDREILLQRQLSAPFRQMYTYATPRIAMKTPSSPTPNHPSASSRTASGYRKTISMSKRMKRIAVR